MPLHRRGEMVTVIHPIGLKDDANRATKCDIGDMLLILKYRPIQKELKNVGNLCMYKFLNSKGQVLSGRVWREHLKTLQ